MSTTTLIYFWGIADNVRHAIGFAAILSLIAIFAVTAWLLIADDLIPDETRKALKKSITPLIVATVFFGTVSMLTPSSKTIAAIAIVPAILDSEVIRTDVPELYEAAKKALLDNLNSK